MFLNRLSRIPKRIAQDLRIVRLARNWTEILGAKLTGNPLRRIELRNGVILNSPEEVNINFLFHEIWLDEFYSPKGYEIGPNQNVVDIGGNIGVFAFYATTRATNVSVHSYEPFPQNAKYFMDNLKESGMANVRFQECAVAGEIGKRTLHVDDSWILHSLTDKDSAAEGITVDCVSLDKVIADAGPCDFLKLDCEGGEYEILYAASKEALDKISRIVCEFNVIDNAKKNGNSLREFLLESGFIVDTLKQLDRQSGFICARRHGS